MLKKTIIRIAEILAALVLLFAAIWFVLSQPMLSPEKIKTPQANSETLYHYVETLSQRLLPRVGEEVKLVPTIEWIEKQLGAYGTTHRQSYKVDSYKIEGETFHNIIIRFGPDTQHVTVIGAHYDTHEELPGADDNASGVAGLIELARLLSQTKLDSRVELVAYTLEEPPYYATENMGSYIHAKSMKDAGKDVTLMMSLEMIGYFSDEPDSQHYPVPYLDWIYPNKGNFIGLVSNLSNMGTVRDVKKGFKQGTDLPVYSINAPAFIPGIDFSDHRNYWAMGYPAIMITDTAFARNTAYHTVYDTADRLDYKKMAQVVEATYNTVIQHVNQ